MWWPISLTSRAIPVRWTGVCHGRYDQQDSWNLLCRNEGEKGKGFFPKVNTCLVTRVNWLDAGGLLAWKSRESGESSCLKQRAYKRKPVEMRLTSLRAIISISVKA